MDAKAFTTFLKSILVTEAQSYQTVLADKRKRIGSGNLFATIEILNEIQRTSGIEDTLKGIADSLENVLTDFYKKGGNTKPLPVAPEEM